MYVCTFDKCLPLCVNQIHDLIDKEEEYPKPLELYIQAADSSQLNDNEYEVTVSVLVYILTRMLIKWFRWHICAKIEECFLH